MPGTAGGDPWACGLSVPGRVGARRAAPLRKQLSRGGTEGSLLCECGAGRDGTVPSLARRLYNDRAGGQLFAASRGPGKGLLSDSAGALRLPAALAGVAGRVPPPAGHGSRGGVSGSAGPGAAGAGARSGGRGAGVAGPRPGRREGVCLHVASP